MYANAFNYTASGGIASMRLGNGQWETAKFNNRLQVEELGLGHSATNAGTWKVNYEFGEYDPNSQTVTGSKNTGNIARQTVSFDGLPNAFVQTYQYDSLYRLTDANEMAGSSENWSEKFTYDRYGNRDKKFRNGLEITNNALSHPSIDPNTNRFTTTGYGYDKVGNLVTDAEGRNFTFDGNNKQRIVYDGNQTVGEYFYDGDGMRVKKKVYSNGTHTKTVVFVYSGGKLIEEYSTEAPPTDKKIKYLTKDHLGTPRIITDGNGAVVSRRDFMPFGEEIANNVGTRSTSSFKYSANEDDVRQKFTGYQQDSETNLDFAEARMYENRHARFTAVDPLLASGKSSNPQSFNRYVYVYNNPLLFTDPTGKCPVGRCRDSHSGVVYTNGRRFSDEKGEGDEWVVFEGTTTTVNEGTGTNITVTGGYVDGVYYGGWYPTEEHDFLEVNESTYAPLTDIDLMARGANIRFNAVVEGIPKGILNGGIKTHNFVQYSNPLCQVGACIKFTIGTIPYSNSLAADYGSAGEVATEVAIGGAAVKGLQLARGVTASVVPKVTQKALSGFDKIVSNPAKHLIGKSAEQVQKTLGKGWTRKSYGKTGEPGWQFIKGDRKVVYHGAGGRHKGEYWYYTSGKTGRHKFVKSDYRGEGNERATIHTIK